MDTMDRRRSCAAHHLPVILGVDIPYLRFDALDTLDISGICHIRIRCDIPSYRILWQHIPRDPELGFTSTFMLKYDVLYL